MPRSFIENMWENFYGDDEKYEDMLQTMEPYKLHINIDHRVYGEYREKICALLEQAIQSGVIKAFKMLDASSNDLIGSLQRSRDRLVKEDTDDKRMALKGKLRAFNNPVVIYLHNDVDSVKLTELCNNIENILAKVLPVEDSLSDADIPLSNRISYRRDSLFGIYISIADASWFVLAILKIIATSSSLFKSLTTCFNSEKKLQEDNPIQISLTPEISESLNIGKEIFSPSKEERENQQKQTIKPEQTCWCTIL